MSAYIRVNRSRLDAKQPAITVGGLKDDDGQRVPVRYAYQVDFIKDGQPVAHVIQIDHSVYMEPAGDVELELRDTP